MKGRPVPCRITLLRRHFIGELGRPDHHGRRRGRPPAAMARKARRAGAEGPLRDLLVQLGVVTEALNAAGTHVQ